MRHPLTKVHSAANTVPRNPGSLSDCSEEIATGPVNLAVDADVAPPAAAQLVAAQGGVPPTAASSRHGGAGLTCIDVETNPSPHTRGALHTKFEF